MAIRILACLLISSTALLANPAATRPAGRITTAPAGEQPSTEGDALDEAESVPSLDSIATVLNIEVNRLMNTNKHQEARALLDQVEADLTAHATANELPLWDVSIASLFQNTENRRTALARQAAPGDRAGSSPAAVQLSQGQVRQLSSLRRELAAAETLVRRGRLSEGEAIAEKVMADLEELTREPEVPHWHRAVAPTFRAAGDILAAREARQQPRSRRGLLNPHGPAAPAFTARTLDGKMLSSRQFDGKWVVLQFWATWCGPCRQEMPNLKNLHETFGNDERLAIVSLSIDTDASRARGFVAQEKLDWTQGILQGGWQAVPVKAYGVRGIPAIFLISPDGRIAASGLREGATKDAVAEALGLN